MEADPSEQLPLSVEEKIQVSHTDIEVNDDVKSIEEPHIEE
jgi:hypothetical protein